MTFCPIVYPLCPPILLSNYFVLTNYCSRLSIKQAAASLSFVPVHLDPCGIFAPSTGRDSHKLESLTWHHATFRLPPPMLTEIIARILPPTCKNVFLAAHSSHCMNRWANYFHRSGAFQSRYISCLMPFPPKQKKKKVFQNVQGFYCP